LEILCKKPNTNSKTAYYCEDKMIRHFREIAKSYRDGGFELIEDLQLYSDSSFET
jgi:hypothetical protein